MALIAGLALATGVNSANTVGYFYKPLTGEANNDVTSMFGAVGGDNSTLKLGDIKGAGDFSILNGDSLTVYSGGAAVIEAVYFPRSVLTMLEQPASVEEGWWDVTVGDELDFSDTTLCYNNFSLPFGTGFTVYASSDESQLLFCGEVQGEVEVTFTGEENNDSGNVVPKSVTLGQIRGNADFSILNGDSLTVYSGGAAVVEAVYFPRSVLTMLEQPASVEEGWWDVTVGDELDFSDTTLCYNSYTLAAGQGFTVYASSDDSGLVFPNPIPAE